MVTHCKHKQVFQTLVWLISGNDGEWFDGLVGWLVMGGLVSESDGKLAATF